jgi:hypothetical protein
MSGRVELYTSGGREAGRLGYGTWSYEHNAGLEPKLLPGSDDFCAEELLCSDDRTSRWIPRIFIPITASWVNPAACAAVVLLSIKRKS